MFPQMHVDAYCQQFSIHRPCSTTGAHKLGARHDLPDPLLTAPATVPKEFYALGTDLVLKSHVASTFNISVSHRSQ